jgi:hypothetical protein
VKSSEIIPEFHISARQDWIIICGTGAGSVDYCASATERSVCRVVGFRHNCGVSSAMASRSLREEAIAHAWCI